MLQRILLFLCLICAPALAEEPALPTPPEQLPEQQLPQQIVTMINHQRVQELADLLGQPTEEARVFIRLVASSFGSLESDGSPADDLTGTVVVSHALGEDHQAGIRTVHYALRAEKNATARLEVQRAATDDTLKKIRVLGGPANP